MKQTIIFMNIIGKLGYIGMGMSLAAILEYGITRHTIGAIILAILVVVATHLAVHSEIKLYGEEEETETV